MFFHVCIVKSKEKSVIRDTTGDEKDVASYSNCKERSKTKKKNEFTEDRKLIGYIYGSHTDRAGRSKKGYIDAAPF